MRWLGGIVSLLVVCVSLGGCAREELTQVDIFYTADMEGFYWSRPEPRLNNRSAGGFGVLKNFLAQQTVPFLLFDGGNWFGSAPEGAMTQGAYIAQLAKTLPYTAGSVADKDFVFGWPSLRNIVRELPFPFIVSNLKLDGQIPWPMHDYQIFTVQGLKIGVFGLINPDEIRTRKSRLAGFMAQDALESARAMTQLLREKNVDYVIVLSALGDSDVSTLSDSELAAEVPGIDLILSANKDRDAAETEQINNTFIVYPGSKLDSVARVRLTFDKNKQLKGTEFEDIVLLKETYGEDEEIALQAAALHENTRAKLSKRLTTSNQEIATSFTQESLLGDLLTDCLHRWAKLDGAILNSDSIRNPLPAGMLTEYDLYNTYPYGDGITFITMRGEAFSRALEASLAASDNFPQIAGFSVSYNPDAPAGQKIKQIVLANGRIIRPNDTYRFAVTDHIVAGGFGHDEFIDSLEFKNTFVEARQIMRACLVRKKQLALPQTGRWKKIK